MKVSDTHRFLVTADGRPFFWLGDTAWELFHRLNREEATRYLEDRAGKGFTVIQAVALAELDGLNTPNAYGHRPFLNNDPARPAVMDGPDNDYWDHVDFVVRRANELGLRMGFLPTWGDKWHKGGGKGPLVFNPDNARTYGEWLGRRYLEAGLVWFHDAPWLDFNMVQTGHTRYRDNDSSVLAEYGRTPRGAGGRDRTMEDHGVPSARSGSGLGAVA